VCDKRVLRRISGPWREEANVTVQEVYTFQPNIIRVTGMRGLRNTCGFFVYSYARYTLGKLGVEGRILLK